MSAGMRQDAVKRTQKATHALASLERKKAGAAQLAKAIAKKQQKRPHSQRTCRRNGPMDTSRKHSRLQSNERLPVHHHDPTGDAGTIDLSRNLVAANQEQSGGSSAYGKPVPTHATPTHSRKCKRGRGQMSHRRSRRRREGS
ncbi:hypothetical protein ERJ75_001095400 [Trypanosoma vivax]|nr:hypothetical protein ERJ75_001095400 [Trypanosoma vivax]